MSGEGSDRPAVTGRQWLRHSIPGGSALALLAVPALAVVEPGSTQHVALGIEATLLAACVFAALRLSAMPRWLTVPGALVLADSLFLLSQTSYPSWVLLIAALCGAGVALLLGGRSIGGRRGVAAALAVAVALALLRRVGDRDVMLAAAAMVAFVGVVTGLGAGRHGGHAGGRRKTTVLPPVLAGCAVLCGVLLTSWIGANLPEAEWFAPAVTHGPRDRDAVALTFDGGPNVFYTLQIQAVLDSYGDKATFFNVGTAVDAEPEISRALIADGDLIASHSYIHNSIRWIDPRYTLLAQAQNAFGRRLGVCPAFFRPPHGRRTPFMAHVVRGMGMTMVTWDVSSNDWAETDPQLVARRVLGRVRPGSIISLHDGFEGNLASDRSVTLDALPLILAGLRARHLKAVRLDELLDTPGYLPCNLESAEHPCG